MVRKYSDLYLDARKALLPGEGQQRAGLLARELLCAASGKTQEEILVRRDQYAPSDVCEKMADFTARALAGEPLAYILEEWDFYGMTLYVNRDVLIPRDDTCAVTELAMKKALYLDQDPRILDLCSQSPPCPWSSSGPWWRKWGTPPGRLLWMRRGTLHPMPSRATSSASQ